MKKENWVDKEVKFYDFIWQEGLSACSKCINDKIAKDFKSGGNQFEEMKKAIFKKFPTREKAIKLLKNYEK